jgi:esterase/lipase
LKESKKNHPIEAEGVVDAMKEMETGERREDLTEMTEETKEEEMREEAEVKEVIEEATVVIEAVTEEAIVAEEKEEMVTEEKEKEDLKDEIGQMMMLIEILGTTMPSLQIGIQETTIREEVGEMISLRHVEDIVKTFTEIANK